MSLKQKTISGLFWSLIDSVANQGIQFVFGIILARILSPKEFGLIGMLAIFIAISQSIIDSGFTQALIRKKSCTQTDYSTVFFFNLFVGLLLYFILFVFASTISSFFNEPVLKSVLRVLGLSLIFNSLSIIQKARLAKEINFKLQTRISITASVASGIVALIMAYKGFGVWSLVSLTLVRFFLNSLLLWVWGKWQPVWEFSVISFRELFSFGSRLLVSGLIDTIYQNVYYLVIGKYFSSTELGYYTRADQFNALPSQNLQGIISRVSYPVLVTIRDDLVQLKSAFKKLIRSTMLISFVLMIGMAVVAKPMIIVLIGEKWIPAVEYLQMLCFVGMFYPLHALNLNMLQVQGRSDLFLRLEVIKKSIAVPVIIIGVFYGIKAMILGMFINTLIAYYLNSYWSGKFIGYSFSEQLKDILPAFLLALVVNGFVFLIGILIDVPPVILLFLQILSGGILTFSFCELFKFKDYLYLKTILTEKLIGRR
jgi:teichuronic acid exporter